jgi:hypothetical protein
MAQQMPGIKQYLNMRKLVFTLFFISFTTFLFSQEKNIEIVVEKTQVKVGEIFHFDIQVEKIEILEIMIFSDDLLVMNQKAQLREGVLNPFNIPTSELPLGKYVLLVSGENFQRNTEFWIWKP